MSQEYMPGRVGVASGLRSASPSGSAASRRSRSGAVADALDLEAAVLATTLGPALCIFLTLLLPHPRTLRPLEPAAAASPTY